MNITTQSITEFEDLVKIMPLVLEGYHAMSKRKKVFDVDEEGFVSVMIGIINTAPRNGLVVVKIDDVPVGYGAAYDVTQQFAKKKTLLLYALYVRPNFGKGAVKALFDEAEKMAKEQGYSYLIAQSARFNGAAYRLFEQRFGMRRDQILFRKEL